MDARVLYFTEPGAVELRTETLGAPDPDELLVETVVSGISTGSELLVYRGEVPEGMAVDETIDALDGEFAYPLRYGYAAVGDVVAAGDAVDDGWVGRRVFAFEPHAEGFRTTPEAVVPLPEGLGAGTATLLPTVETATTFVLDGAPRIGERAVVFGAGLVGLCTTHLLADFPLDRLVVVDPIETRRDLALDLGADVAVPPESDVPAFGDAEPPGADLAYELSGRPATLEAAVEAVGYDGRIVVGSWYGTRRAPVDLGGSFHRDRISVESSQVSTIAPSLRGRWDRGRRFDVAVDGLRTLDDPALPTTRMPFEDAPEAYRRLDERATDALHVVLTYP